MILGIAETEPVPTRGWVGLTSPHQVKSLVGFSLRRDHQSAWPADKTADGCIACLPERFPHRLRNDLNGPGRRWVDMPEGGVGIQIGQLNEVRLIRMSWHGIIDDQSGRA